LCGEKEKRTDMQEGTVKWFSSEKGFGFIKPEDGSEDVFVHHSEVPGEDLRDGERVEFDVEQTPKGLSAINVQRLKNAL
jgi:CspA family cold shock protein